MSALSNVDLEKELKSTEHIRIYPLTVSNIKGSTYNLTASDYAWSLSTKESIVSNGVIKIPKHDTGIIATKEVIWVSEKISGTYHSKVSIVTAGGGHIGTTLDPTWMGHSIIAVHNHTDDFLEIGVDSTFVSIMFHYLHSPSTKIQDNSLSQIDHLHQFNLTRTQKAYFDTSWKKIPEDLQRKVKIDTGYKELEKNMKKDYNFKAYFSIFIIAVIILSCLYGASNVDKDSFWHILLLFIPNAGFSGILVYYFIQNKK
ncbi:hypothetical protein QWY16_09330 [Planococcus shenhongbingii]|uniref:hypothetical protein n=1 Tax=Planococcus shenhongbingii TaxID=3058398 RepID=UPI002624C2B5|nr:hypothetical protein [Planococcus sp. N016]WKA60286.1 hypothetical protein QWY16_09330 [Planococcus sp. N016]